MRRLMHAAPDLHGSPLQVVQALDEPSVAGPYALAYIPPVDMAHVARTVQSVIDSVKVDMAGNDLDEYDVLSQGSTDVAADDARRKGHTTRHTL
jgi:hypothetical protein